MASFELFKGKDGQYYWRLRSGNGQIVATGGEGFKDKSGATNGIASVQRDAGAANVVDLSG